MPTAEANEKTRISGILLAAGTSRRMGFPKLLLPYRGQPLLQRLVDTLNGGGVRDITVVRGYKKNMVNLPTIKTIDNESSI